MKRKKCENMTYETCDAKYLIKKTEIRVVIETVTYQYCTRCKQAMHEHVKREIIAKR